MKNFKTYLKGCLIAGIIIFIIVGAVLYFKFKSEFTEYERFNSPDGKYTLIVYIDSSPSYLVTSFHSDSSYREAYVVLIDKKDNKTLAKTNFFNGCYFIIGDMEIEWDMKNEKVHFTKFNYIDLNTMRMSCM